MKSNDTSTDNFFDRPFPLQRKFRRYIVPGMLLFTLAMLVVNYYSSKAVMETIYLDMAQKRAETIKRAVSTVQPEAWKALLDGEVKSVVRGKVAYKHLYDAFASEVKELKLAKLKVYDLNAFTIYSTDAAGIGSMEQGKTLKRIIDSGKPGINLKVYPSGLEMYELYVPLLDQFGRLKAVFELYEPVTFLNEIIFREAIPTIAIPGVMLILFLISLGRLVAIAQQDIDQRTDSLKEMTRRLETFVSESALKASRKAASTISPLSTNIHCTLLFTDVRDFTGFAETQSPERVVKFLNELMSIQIAIIRRHGGDVDKMIGDAVLAIFQGEGAERRAIVAGSEILLELKEGFLPRSVGIGIYSGDVISGAIGPPERRDYTVIGDSVNVSARLCSLAKVGEMIVDNETLNLAGIEGEDNMSFKVPEIVSIKGRKDGLSACRSIL